MRKRARLKTAVTTGVALAGLPLRVPSRHTGQSVWAHLAYLVRVPARPFGLFAGAAALAAGALASEGSSVRRGGAEEKYIIIGV